jgi:hypothetical protein
MKINDLKSDVHAESEGKWFDVPRHRGVKVKLRRINCPEYNAVLSEKVEAWRKGGRWDGAEFEEIPDEIWQQIGEECFAEVIWLDISGVEDEDGSPIQWSPEVALAWIRDESMKHFIAQVTILARQRDRWMLADKKEVEKNLPDFSASESSGNETPSS